MKKFTFILAVVICLMGMFSASAYAYYASYAGGLAPSAYIESNATNCGTGTWDYYDQNTTTITQSGGIPTTHEIRVRVYNTNNGSIYSAWVETSHNTYSKIADNLSKADGYQARAQILNDHTVNIATSGRLYRVNP